LFFSRINITVHNDSLLISAIGSSGTGQPYTVLASQRKPIPLALEQGKGEGISRQVSTIDPDMKSYLTQPHFAEKFPPESEYL
jgi:hypothetical protein